MSASTSSSHPGATFGPIDIPSTQIFHETPTTFALVNLKPVVPGHVLVCPRRVARKFTDLSDDEIGDLWRTVAAVQRVMERVYDTTSSTLAIQDGPLAGQSVPHVHVHVLPRREGDFARNDDVYDELEKWRALDDDRAPRTAEEMKSEADTLRVMF
jgi:bis(5'-adenosyl)-triphosphatase